MNLYEVIRRPLVTEKGVLKKDTERTLCFEVSAGANKTQVKSAVEKLFKRTGFGFDDLNLIEINEAFAVQVLAVLSGWGVKLEDVDDRLNVNGSGISLGHPIGATGVRILTTMLHELRRRGGGLALETMCIGGGQGIAAVFRGVTP